MYCIYILNIVYVYIKINIWHRNNAFYRNSLKISYIIVQIIIIIY